MDIGYIDFSAMKGGSIESSGFVWIRIPNLINTIFWYGRATAIRYGFENTNSASYTFDNYITSFFDSGTSMVLVPADIAADFFGKILEG